MRKFLSAVTAVMFCFISFTYVHASDINRLFIIERSKNANIVCYDVKLSQNGTIDSKKPIDAYWLLYAEKTGDREELSVFDKKAYGFKTDYNEQTKNYTLALKAVENKNMAIVSVNGKYKAQLLINNTPAYLDKVYIQSKDGTFGIPTVYFYVLYGKTVSSDENIEEKIILKK